MQMAFRKQGRAFLAVLNHRAGVLAGRLRESAGDVLPPDWEAIYDTVVAEDVLFTAATRQAVEDALLTGAQHAMGDFSVAGAFDLSNPRAAAYLETHAAEAVTAINVETKAQMRAVITAGLRDGQTYDQIAKSIRERFAGFSTPKPQQHIRSRAHLVAVTEAGDAYEQGNRAVVDDLTAAGLQMEKSWLTVGDNRVSDGCADNEGAGWIPVDDAFPSGHQEPLRFPGCRCSGMYRRAASAARAAA